MCIAQDKNTCSESALTGERVTVFCGYMNKVEYNVRVRALSKRNGSLSLSPSFFKQKEEVVRPKTRAGPHERRNEKTGGEDGTDEMVRW